MAKLLNEFTQKELETINNEFKRAKGKVYLDNAGTTLYSEKQIDFISEMLKTNLFCNPHTCKITGDLVDQVRFKILKHFNTDPNEYTVVFTASASASLKTVAECFEFGSTGTFTYCQENHTSVLGMRDVVNTKNIFVVTKEELLENLTSNKNSSENLKNISGNSLVTFSAQCNLSGYKMPLDLIPKIQKNNLKNHGKCIRGENCEHSNNFYICLDAASFAATNLLNLGRYKPDFVCISFYKIFGYPTGLGALIVSRRGQQVLKKKFFGGGTVKIAMTREDFHEKRDGFSEKFEDGTLSFLSIAALLEGFRTQERLVPPTELRNSIQRISNHVYYLAKYCYDSLRNMKHPNGQNLVKFYNHTNFESVDSQGGIICFNILNADGSFVGFAEVACIAAINDIILRCGCFCNAGACQTLLKLDDEEIKKHYQAGHICSDYNDLVDGVPTGAVRLSFGYMTAKSDVDAAINMIQTCYLSETEEHRINTICKSELPSALRHIPQKLFQQLRQHKGIRLRKICIYPIKSCGAFEITDKWELNENGLKYDRIWMIVDSNGMAVTQKTATRLCIIKPIINLEKKQLEINFLGNNSISIPLESNEQNGVFSSLCQSKVCGDLVEGFDCGKDIANWLSTVLEIPGLRLIQQRFDLDRKKRDGSPKDINLSNQAQFLLINFTSVSWLASKVQNWGHDYDGDDIDGIVGRFRGNLIIETEKPLIENQFKKFQINNIDFKLEGPCTRCQMICIDQKTGLRTAEPLKTISKEFNGRIKFGIYLSVQEGGGKNRFLSCDDDIFVEYLNK